MKRAIKTLTQKEMELGSLLVKDCQTTGDIQEKINLILEVGVLRDHPLSGNPAL